MGTDTISWRSTGFVHVHVVVHLHVHVDVHGKSGDGKMGTDTDFAKMVSVPISGADGVMPSRRERLQECAGV
jgi:hypothetical protein